MVDKLLVLVAVLVQLSDAIFFGGGGGGCNCGCSRPQSVCPPPPVCPSSCPTGAGGFYQPSPSYTSYGGSVPVPIPVSGGGTYAVSPGITGPVAIPTTGVQGSYVSSGSLAGGRLDGYISPTAARSSTKIPTRDTYMVPGSPEKDFYDDAVPPSLKFSDVSAEAKDLQPYDLYKRRYLALKNLRHRRLRQLGAPSVAKEYITSTACNNEKLAKIMAKSMVTDISISKRLVRKATELAFGGLKFDVICAVGDFSYSIYAEQYCETTRGNVTCFAFV